LLVSVPALRSDLPLHPQADPDAVRSRCSVGLLVDCDLDCDSEPGGPKEPSVVQLDPWVFVAKVLAWVADCWPCLEFGLAAVDAVKLVGLADVT